MVSSDVAIATITVPWVISKSINILLSYVKKINCIICASVQYVAKKGRIHPA